MQPSKSRWRLRKEAARDRVHRCIDAGPQPSRPVIQTPSDPYGVHMRINPSAESSTWASLVRTHRQLARLSQEKLADEVGTARSTVWRWENSDQKPESYSMAVLVINRLHIDREV